MEIWKDIKNFEGYYQVSDTGKYRSVDRTEIRSNGRKHTVRGKVLKGSTNPQGYIIAVLYKNKKKYFKALARIVAQTFIPNPKKKPEVNHKSGNIKDNSISNLEWTTCKENVNHAWRIGLCKPNKGVKHGGSKLTESDVLDIRKQIADGARLIDMADKYSVYYTTISKIKNTKTWAHI